MRPRLPAVAIIVLTLASCSNSTPPATQASTSAAAANASAEATVDGVVVHASTMPASQLNAITARKYGIAIEGDALFLLVTVRDEHGNGVPADAVQLTAQSAVLPDTLAPLPLRAITVDGMTDYIATVAAKPPASVQFAIDVHKGTANAKMAFTRDVLPR